MLTQADKVARAKEIFSITKDSSAVTEAFPSILMRANLSDEEAVKFEDMYPVWTPGETYTLDWIIRYEGDGELYRIGQTHTAQSQWVPGTTGTEALYSHINIDEEGYEYWKAWDGVTGLYQEGDIRRDPEDEQLYICTGNNCTYGPPHSTPDWWQLYTE